MCYFSRALSGSGPTLRCGIAPACGILRASNFMVREQSMKLKNVSFSLALLSVLWLGVSPAWGVSKEIIELQTQVQQLQQQMTGMQRSFDERMGVMKNLVEQDTDAVNKVAGALTLLQTTLAKQQADSSGHGDQLSGQIQALNDSIDELKVRLTKVTK